jgi:hypothetical protein
VFFAVAKGYFSNKSIFWLKPYGSSNFWGNFCDKLGSEGDVRHTGSLYSFELLSREKSTL